MRVEEGLHLVMSGAGGFDLTDAFDCNAFVLDAGNGEWVLFDAGAGRDLAAVEAILAADGIRPGAIRHRTGRNDSWNDDTGRQLAILATHASRRTSIHVWGLARGRSPGATRSRARWHTR